MYIDIKVLSKSLLFYKPSKKPLFIKYRVRILVEKEVKVLWEVMN